MIVIDPGIKFAENLRKYFNIEPHDVRSVIVTHYHPDHTMGLYELLTLTHESHYPCSYYLNRTTYESFKIFQGKYNKIVELNKDQTLNIAKYYFTDDSGWITEDRNLKKPNEFIYLKTKKTFHEEIGNRHNSLGFVFDITTFNGRNYRLVLLGDTDGNADYHNTYLNYMKDCNIAILHLGSFSEKGYGVGNKHLYETGIMNIINCINCKKEGFVDINYKKGKIENCIRDGIIKRDNNGRITHINCKKCNILKGTFFDKLELVIISELGLEMAQSKEFLESIQNFKWATNLYPFLIFLKFYNHHGDEYVTKFCNNTKNIGLCDYDKMGIHREVFSTKAVESINELLFNAPTEQQYNEILNKCKSLALSRDEFQVDSNYCLVPNCERNSKFGNKYERLIDEIDCLLNDNCGADEYENHISNITLKSYNIISQEKINLCELYSFSIYVSSFLYYTAFNKIQKKDWVEIGVPKDQAEINRSMGLKLEKLIEVVLPSADGSDLTFEGFCDILDNKINHDETLNIFTIPFGMAVNDLIKRLIENANLNYFNISPNEPNPYGFILDDLSKLSSKIFSSIECENSKKYRVPTFNNFTSFVKSISLFGQEYNKELSEDPDNIYDYIYRKIFYSKKVKFFNPLVCLFAFELKKQVEILRSEADKIETNKNGFHINKDLWILLKNYSEKNVVKYFLSDIGIEIDFSSEQLRIKHHNGDLIPVSSAIQEIISNDYFVFRHI